VLGHDIICKALDDRWYTTSSMERLFLTCLKFFVMTSVLQRFSMRIRVSFLQLDARQKSDVRRFLIFLVFSLCSSPIPFVFIN
jgi:hypothetical protein